MSSRSTGDVHSVRVRRNLVGYYFAAGFDGAFAAAGFAGALAFAAGALVAAEAAGTFVLAGAATGAFFFGGFFSLATAFLAYFCDCIQYRSLRSNLPFLFLSNFLIRASLLASRAFAAASSAAACSASVAPTAVLELVSAEAVVLSVALVSAAALDVVVLVVVFVVTEALSGVGDFLSSDCAKAGDAVARIAAHTISRLLFIVSSLYWSEKCIAYQASLLSISDRGVAHVIQDGCAIRMFRANRRPVSTI